MMMFSDNLNIEVNYLLVSMCGEYNSRRLRLIIEAYHLAAREQRAVVLSLLRRAVLAVDVDEGGGHRILFLYLVDISNTNDIMQVLIGAVIECRLSCWILVLAIYITVVIAFWNADNHSLASSGK